MSETIKIKILFLASDPSDIRFRLHLDEEVRRIDQKLRMTSHRDKFEFVPHWAVRRSDLQELLLRHQPHIVHFSGHGSPQGEIILMDEAGGSFPVPPYELSNLFSILKDNIRCIVLNACYSELQACAIAEHIDCVIGMSKAIDNESAIDFSSAFYQALGYGRNLKTAFKLGCLESRTEKLGDALRLIANRIDPETICLTSEIGQVALKDQLNKLTHSLNSKQYKQAESVCRSILENYPEHPEANLVIAICLLNGKTSDRHSRDKMRQVESYLNRAVQYPSTANAAWIIMGLVKYDHYYPDEPEGEPTLDETKRSISANLTQSDNYCLTHINASSEAYSWLGISKPNPAIGKLSYGR